MNHKLNTGKLTVITLESLRHYEQSGQRPEGYVAEYREIAEKVDEENGLVWISREAQDRLIEKYRVEDTPERREKAENVKAQIAEMVRQKKRAGESEEEAQKRLREDSEIKALRDQIPRLGPDASGANVDPYKIKRGLEEQELKDTPEEKRAETLLQKVQSKKLNAEMAIDIKRRLGIQDAAQR